MKAMHHPVRRPPRGYAATSAELPGAEQPVSATAATTLLRLQQRKTTYGVVTPPNAACHPTVDWSFRRRGVASGGAAIAVAPLIGAFLRGKRLEYPKRGAPQRRFRL